MAASHRPWRSGDGAGASPSPPLQQPPVDVMRRSGAHAAASLDQRAPCSGSGAVRGGCDDSSGAFGAPLCPCSPEVLPRRRCEIQMNLFKHQILENTRDACILSLPSMVRFLLVLIWWLFKTVLQS